MHEEAYRPLPAEELADGMQLTPEDLVQFDAALEELEKRARSSRIAATSTASRAACTSSSAASR